MRYPKLGLAFALICFLPVLAGCTDADWDRLNVFPALGEPDSPVPTQAQRPGPEDTTAQAWHEPVARPPARPRPANDSPGAVSPATSYRSQPGDDFCHQAAATEAQDAIRDGFNRETVQTRYNTRLEQCQTLLGQ